MVFLISTVLACLNTLSTFVSTGLSSHYAFQHNIRENKTKQTLQRNKRTRMRIQFNQEKKYINGIGIYVRKIFSKVACTHKPLAVDAVK